MSVTTTITCVENDHLNITAAVQDGTLNLSLDDDLVLLKFDSEDYGIKQVICGEGTPTYTWDGVLYRNTSNGELYFSADGDFHLVGIIEKREGVNVISRTLKVPPLYPSEGDQYMVPKNAPAWGGLGNQIARFANGRWFFIVPTIGQTVGVRDEGIDYTYSGYAWEGNVDTLWISDSAF